jgi:hypothetical protein
MSWNGAACASENPSPGPRARASNAWPVLALSLLLGGACSQDASPIESVPVAGAPVDSGGMSAGTGGAGGGAAQPLTFNELYTQAFWSCKRSICHGGAVAGLDMSTPAAAHAGLVNQPAQANGICAFTGMTRVVPFQPDQSLLIGKLQPTAPCGQQMPIGGLLSEENRAAVRAWIAAGAPFD